MGVFFSPFPLSIPREKELHTHHGAPPEMDCGFSSVSPEGTGERAQPCSSHSPGGWWGLSAPLRGVCVPNATQGLTHPGMGRTEDVGWKRPAGTRSRIFSLQNLQGKLWGLFPLLPSLFSPPASAHPRDARLGTHPGDTARL